MISRDHVTKALEDALAHPKKPDGLGSDMAFAAGSAALLMIANAALPGAGGIAAAASIPFLNRLRMGEPSTGVPQHIEDAVRYTCAVRQLGDEGWNAWVPWNELCQGARVTVPEGLKHPRELGFEETFWAKSCGQAKDWVKSLPDGSRLHVHEYADGRLELHRDELDPARGPGVAAVHWLAETREGNVLAASLTVAALVAVWEMTEI